PDAVHPGSGNALDGGDSGQRRSSCLQTLKGFKGVTFLADETVGEYGGLSLWETKEDAEAATSALRPWLQVFS
ncbi:MAG: hypothetical protein ACE5IG_07855, partial [Dehalococcoidia bacterium]